MASMSEVNTLPAMPPEQTRVIEALVTFPLRSLIVLEHAEAGEPRTAGQQAQDLEARQGNHVVLPAGPHSRDLIAGASKHALFLGGILEKTSTINSLNRPATAFNLTELGWRYAVPAAATLLDWELRFPLLSLRERLGYGRLQEGAGKPVVLLDTYEQLITRPSTFSDILERTGHIPHKISKALVQQLENDTLELSTKTPANRRITISPHDMSRMPGRTDIGRAAHHASRSLCDKGTLTVTGQEFLDEVARLYPEIDPASVWRAITANHHAYLTFVDQGDFGSDTNSKGLYSIAAPMRSAITDLVLRHQGLRDGNLNFTATARMLGKRILSLPQVVSFLLVKGGHYASAEEDSWASYARARRTIDVLPSLTRGALDWRHFSACRDADPELFFPVGTAGPAIRQTAEAKKVCGGCVVRFECLDWATASGQTEGIFGGKTPDERRGEKKRTLARSPSTNGRISAVLEKDALILK